ncbi:glucose-6-phosphate isomerase [Solibacillus sp. CAU 1738]|uniref:glucose-6-phosphate isomerase n=1 Tax=Solibacillus sp. CAU 1738 TaxID=3140363 RepID=UPI00326116AD
MPNKLLSRAILDDSLIGINIDWSEYYTPVSMVHDYLEEVSDELTGWIKSPLERNKELLTSIDCIASEIKMNANVLIVIGVGGSFLGAKAIQDALTPYFGLNKNGISVIYVGQNMSGAYIQQLLNSLEDKEIYVNVVSKSGTTMEPAIAFRVFRNYMKKRYGQEYYNRIIVTTDAEKGLLKQIADKSYYRQFYIPSNIGGRYSVLTPVGLLPIAVAGVNIYQLLEGAYEAAILLQEERVEQNEAYRYAVIRNELFKRGYQVELLASFEPSLAKLHEWWKQLFAESEGKDKKGLFPSSVSFSTDLHSIGQFIQEGNPILFETILYFNEINEDCSIPFDEQDDDQLNYLSSKSINEVNAVSKEGVIAAHTEAGVPIIQLQFEKLDAYHLGYLVYFFMKACAMSAYLLNVNPFNQPGVEAYKKKTLEMLIKETVYG